MVPPDRERHFRTPSGLLRRGEEPIVSRLQALIARVVRHRLPIARVPTQADFYDLCIDPLERVLIAHAVEIEWSIELTDAEIDAWLTVEDVATSISQRGVM
jgi:acyl carrier protein